MIAVGEFGGCGEWCPGGEGQTRTERVGLPSDWGLRAVMGTVKAGIPVVGVFQGLVKQIVVPASGAVDEVVEEDLEGKSVHVPHGAVLDEVVDEDLDGKSVHVPHGVVVDDFDGLGVMIGGDTMTVLVGSPRTCASRTGRIGPMAVFQRPVGMVNRGGMLRDCGSGSRTVRIGRSVGREGRRVGTPRTCGSGSRTVRIGVLSDDQIDRVGSGGMLNEGMLKVKDGMEKPCGSRTVRTGSVGLGSVLTERETQGRDDVATGLVVVLLEFDVDDGVSTGLLELFELEVETGVDLVVPTEEGLEVVEVRVGLPSSCLS